MKWTAVAVAIVATAGCASKNVPVAQVAKADAAKGTAALSTAETKAIAEEAFIYGLPIAMNYAVMHEYAVEGRPSIQGALQSN